MKTLHKWIQNQMSDFDWLLKKRQDLNYYMQEQARLEKRVEQLEAKVERLENALAIN